MSETKALPDIDSSRCTGCGRCIAACPPHVLCFVTEKPNGMGRKHASLFQAVDCTGCAKCLHACPFDVIKMVRTSRHSPA